MTPAPTRDVLIARFSDTYLWWKPVGDAPHWEDRIIAQTMNFGTYDDILLLEDAVGRAGWSRSRNAHSRAQRQVVGVLARPAELRDQR